MTLKQGTPASAIGEKILPDTLLNTRYKVIENLGSGGFSNTYLAVDTQRPGSPECVVKQLRPASIEAEYLDVLSRLFKTEAEILERLGKHEQIPQLMASFEENQQFYIVQQFIRGRELSQELLPGQRLVQTEVISLLKQVLEVLSFVHSYGVIHRDVKPSNLIRQESDGRIVLIDFGAVKQIQPQQQDELTIAIGTRGYAAPEQMAGIPRLNSDIYALGMIGIQALTGVEAKKFSRDPNTDGVTVEIPLNMPNISFRSWHELTDADNKLVAILDKMVCLDFYQRYQSAADVLMNLENI
ncbi:serine/threonine protein kinase [Nostoc sphaeroides CHAB 2801]|nr:serine/threonine protein kinase [Nostoc sphaeroides CHAB 2801]